MLSLRAVGRYWPSLARLTRAHAMHGRWLGSCLHPTQISMLASTTPADLGELFSHSAASESRVASIDAWDRMGRICCWQTMLQIFFENIVCQQLVLLIRSFSMACRIGQLCGVELAAQLDALHLVY